MRPSRLGGAAVFPLVVLFGLNAVDELDRTAFALLLPEVQRSFHLNLSGITALSAAIIPAGLLFGIPVAYLADRSRRVTIAILGALAWSVFSVLTGLAPTVALLALARTGAGLGRAVNDPVHGSLLSDYYPPLVRAKVFATHRAANTVGAFFGPLGAGVLAHAFGWRVPFLILAAPTLVFVVLALFLAEPARTGANLGPVNFRKTVELLWEVRTLRRLWLAIPFLTSAAIGLTFLLSLYYRNVFHVPVRTRGLIQAFDAPFILVALFVCAPLIDRGIKRDPGLVVRRIGQLAIVAAILILGLALAPKLWTAMAFAYVLQGLAVVLVTGGVVVISLVAPPGSRASAFAFYGVFALLGVVILPVVGRVGDVAGLRWGMGIVAPVVFVGALIVASAGRFATADVGAAADLSAASDGSPPSPPH